MKTRLLKTELVDENKRLRDKNGLLELYLFDTQTGAEPDARISEVGKESDGTAYTVTGTLYRSTSAHGGYVVLSSRAANNVWANTEIMLLDDTYKIVWTENTFVLRMVAGSLRVARERLLDALQPSPWIQGEQALDGEVR